MPDIGYNYGAVDEELYQTDLYGGTDADLDNTAPVDDADGYTSNIDLTDNMYANINIKFLATGATDDLVLNIFRRRDSSWDGDEIALAPITVDSDGSEDIFNLDLGPHKGFGPGIYRISMQSSGVTDTFDADVQMRRTKYVSA